MNILKKLFGGQKTTEEVRETKEKDFDMVKYDGVRALRMHQFDLAAKSFSFSCFTSSVVFWPPNSFLNMFIIQLFF